MERSIRAISVRDFRSNMSDALGRVRFGGEYIAITRHEQVMAVLIPYEELQELRKLRDAAGGKAVDAAFEDRINAHLTRNDKLYKELAQR